MKHSAIIICCNAELFIERNLIHHQPLFDRIVVVDGPSLAKAGETHGNGIRLTQGKCESTDGTVEVVRKLQKTYPNITLVQKKSPWLGKVEKFNAALPIIDPGYIWQIDSDEFWKHDDVHKLKEYLRDHPEHTEAEFFAYHFWGGPNTYTSMIPGQWGNSTIWRRVFKYNRGNSFVTHEPPRMRRALKENVLTRDETAKMGIFMYHYGYCVTSQFRQREIFYAMKQGQLVNELNDYRSGRIQSPHKLCEFTGKHPIDINFLIE